MTGDAVLARAVMDDYRTAAISARERAMLDFATRLTTEVRSAGKGDVDALRAGGLDDGQILEVAHVVGFFNYFNRLADGLGVDPEPGP